MKKKYLTPSLFAWSVAMEGNLLDGSLFISNRESERGDAMVKGTQRFQLDKSYDVWDDDWSE